MTYRIKVNKPNGLPNLKIKDITKYPGIYINMNLNRKAQVDVLCKNFELGTWHKKNKRDM